MGVCGFEVTIVFGWRGFVDNFVVWFGNVLLSDEFMVYFVDV
ncbi:MAG: hypothetical protein MRT15_08030 [archaeon YNP-LCB-003-016]|nr:hypothetical protein [Candidatus Culexarchaeum yellowstonense]MCR6692325.1 hypothetical protein [Candidatus Culexarchaeum yellowstonense]